MLMGIKGSLGLRLNSATEPLPPPRPPLRFYLRPHRTSEERTETDDAVDSDLARRLIEMGKGRK